LLQKILSLTYVIPKFIAGLLADWQMSIAMARHFVTFGLNFLDQIWEAFGELAEYEHRGSHICLA
jgi:hypothetical protein